MEGALALLVQNISFPTKKIILNLAYLTTIAFVFADLENTSAVNNKFTERIRKPQTSSVGEEQAQEQAGAVISVSIE